MKSILFISLMNGAPWGGSEEAWYRSALYAVSLQHTVACGLYDWEENKGKVSKLEAAGIKVFLFPNKGRKKKNLLQNLRYKWLTKLELSRYIHQLPVSEYDVIVVNQGGYTEVCTSPWKKFYKKLNNYALVFHNYHEQTSLSEKKSNILRNWIGHASVNLFAAGRIKTVLETYLKININNGAVLRNPITFHAPAGLTDYPSKQNGNYIFSMLAALDAERKAQDNLINVLSTNKWMSREWELYLYGNGKDQHLLEQLVLEKNIGHKIHLKGHTSDPEQVLKQSHLVLQITHMDAMPISVIEAMAISRPLVVSRIGDMPEWVYEEKNGWIAENASEKNIDLALEKAWQQRDRWSEMGVHSFEIFSQNYPIDPAACFLDQVLSAEKTPQ